MATSSLEGPPLRHPAGRGLRSAALLAGLVALRPAVTMPLFATPAWGTAGQLEMREEPGNAGSLLLRQTPAGSTYRYSPAPARFERVADERWSALSTPVVACEAQGPPPPGRLAIDPRSGALKAGDRDLVPEGGSAVILRLAPGGKKVAVLSAAGRPKDGLFPFVGRGVAGPYFHQVFSLPEAAALGRPRRLPFASAAAGIVPCWSPSERLVIYFDIVFSHLAVVGVEPEGASHAMH